MTTYSKYSKSDLDKIDSIRCNVESAEKYFSENKARLTSDKSFAFKSTLYEADKAKLAAANRSAVEINIIEAYISRFLGDFVKQVPDLFVSADSNQVAAEKIDIIEGFVRHTFTSSDYRVIAMRVMKDAVCGFGAMEVSTDYKNEMSFDQDIKLKYVDPLLCGFDPMAKTPSKEDGQFCYKLVPRSRKELENEYPDVKLDEIKRTPLNIGDTGYGFSWKKEQSGRDIYFIADYYEKDYKSIKLLLIVDPENKLITSAITEDDYNEKYGGETVGPKIKKEEKRRICKIKRYQIIGNQLLKKSEWIEGRHLPLVFFDGNSVDLDNSQYTRSYFYNVKDAQRIKNISASSFMYDQITMRQTDVIMAKETFPSDEPSQKAWMEPQRAKGALLYNHFSPDGQTPLPPPQVIARGNINPQSMHIFEMQDKTIQSILGSYHSQTGLQGNQSSGVAIENSSVNSSESAAPFIMSYMASLQHIGKMMVDFIPVYFTNQRTIPILQKNGQKDNQLINDVNNEHSKMDYDSYGVGVTIEAGANFEVQRMKSLNTLIELMRASESVKQIMDGDGLPILLDNINIRDKNRLVELSREFVENKKKAAQSQPNPMQIQMQIKQHEMKLKEADLQLKAMKQQNDFKIDIEKLRQSNERLEEQGMEIKATLMLRLEEAKNEDERTQVELEMKKADQQMAASRHAFEMMSQIHAARSGQSGL